jgi:hypothetical protein
MHNIIIGTSSILTPLGTGALNRSVAGQVENFEPACSSTDENPVSRGNPDPDASTPNPNHPNQIEVQALYGRYYPIINSCLIPIS